MTADTVASIEAFTIAIPRDTPYLGSLGPGEEVNERGYIVRRGNRTIYPTIDRSVVVRVTTADGRVGWGETYGLVAPLVVHALIADVIAPFVRGRSPLEVQAVWEQLYDMMRVRGYQGGFWLDAIAAVDIALWDLAGQLCGQPLHNLLGGARRSAVPAYVSGLPRDTLPERQALAKGFVDDGFEAFKIAAVTHPEAIEREVAGLREALGAGPKLMVDMHWMYTPAEAVSLLRRLERYDLFFAEAPCKPEDVLGLAEVARRVAMPVASGEEWRTVFDARPRLEARAVSFVQPEMGHTGLTQFSRIAQLAAAYHVPTIPHATIGVGLFLAASVHASAAVHELPFHEYQHSIFDRNIALLEGEFKCGSGAYSLPSEPGLGVRPREEMWRYVEQPSL